MLKALEIYLIKLFLKKIFTISLIFFSLILILTIFEEISFFKDLDTNFYFIVLMAILNVPSTLFEIFPLIFLISTQFFFLDLIKKDELDFLKISSLANLRIIKILFLTSFFLGLILLSVYYGISSKLKFFYLDLKNSFSNDNKYLAVVKESGLWIKDEINDKIYIINAVKIEDNFLSDVSINEFDVNFNLIKIIEAEKVDISNFQWILFKPSIFQDNNTLIPPENILIETHFNREKINTLFDNLSSLSIFKLLKLNKDDKSLGYSTTEIDSHLHKLYSFPLYVSIMTILTAITMFNVKRNKSMIFYLVLGILLSVIIYYFYYLFILLGESGKIPLLLSIYMPYLMLSLFILIGLVRINEK